jgi:hypothetical protein
MPHALHSKPRNSADRLPGTVLEEWQPLNSNLYDGTHHALAAFALEAPLLAKSPVNVKQEPANVLEIFISYAEHDESLLNELLEHLEVMKRQYAEQEHYHIEIRHSGDSLAGQDWKKNITFHLLQAHIILFLVSIKFLRSELCHATQIQPALDRHDAGEAWVIPVILRSCDWEHEIFGRLRPLPARGKPVTEWHPRDRAYADIIAGIRKAISNLPYPR